MCCNQILSRVVVIDVLITNCCLVTRWTALEYIFASVVDIPERDIVWALRLAMRELSKEGVGEKNLRQTLSYMMSARALYPNSRGIICFHPLKSKEGGECQRLETLVVIEIKK